MQTHSSCLTRGINGIMIKFSPRFIQSEQGQLYPLVQAPPRRENFDSWRWSQHSVHLGLGHAHSTHQGGVDVLSSSVLRAGHQSRQQGLFLLLQRRQHRRVGPSQPDARQVRSCDHQRVIKRTDVASDDLWVWFVMVWWWVWFLACVTPQAVPGPHWWSQLHRHLQRRDQTVDWGTRQHGALLGPERGSTASAARLHLPGTAAPGNHGKWSFT